MQLRTTFYEDVLKILSMKLEVNSLSFCNSRNGLETRAKALMTCLIWLNALMLKFKRLNGNNKAVIARIYGQHNFSYRLKENRKLC